MNDKNSRGFTLPDGSMLILMPDPTILPWQRHLFARRQASTAYSTRQLRRRLEREQKRQARLDTSGRE